MMRRLAFAFLLVLCICSSCATYNTRDLADQLKADMQKKEIIKNCDALEIHAVDFSSKDMAENYLGIKPAEAKMIPLYFEFNNGGNSLIKVNLEETCLIDISGERYRVLPVESAIERAKRSDAEVIGWLFGFGLVGGIISADNSTSVNRSLENDYHAKYFKPTLINPSGTSKGLVFFDCLFDKEPKLSSVTFVVTDLNSRKSTSVNVNLTGGS